MKDAEIVRSLPAGRLVGHHRSRAAGILRGILHSTVQDARLGVDRFRFLTGHRQAIFMSTVVRFGAEANPSVYIVMLPR